MMTKFKHLLAVSALGAALLGSGTAFAQSIDTTGGTGKLEVAPFGVTNTSTYGETFTATANNVLTSYSLYLNGNASNLQFASYIYAWDGNKATGPALFSSAVQSYNGGSDVAFTFNPGANLVSGSKYVAFLTTAGLQAGQANQTVQMPVVSSSTYAGGDFVYYNTGDNFAQLTSNTWDCHDGCGFGDAFFKASFGAAAVPEPASWAMMILGMGAIGYAMRRRKVATRVSYAA